MIVETTYCLIDKTLDDIGVDGEEIPARVEFDTKDIEMLRETVTDDNIIDICKCVVFLKSGESILVNMNYDKLKKLKNNIE